jgi:hypothetical protein
VNKGVVVVAMPSIEQLREKEEDHSLGMSASLDKMPHGARAPPKVDNRNEVSRALCSLRLDGSESVQ